MTKRMWTHDGLIALLIISGYREREEPYYVYEGRPGNTDGKPFMIHESIGEFPGKMTLGVRTVFQGQKVTAKKYKLVSVSLSRYHLLKEYPYTAQGRRDLYDRVLEALEFYDSLP